MGCMNGRCSDDPTATEERGQLMNQPRAGSINSSEYSVSHLPPSPSVTTSRSLDDGPGGVYGQTDRFNQSVGGTLTRELEQHHMITSTQEPELKNGECALIPIQRNQGDKLELWSGRFCGRAFALI